MNGKPLHMYMGQDEQTGEEQSQSNVPATKQSLTMRQFMLSLVPFTPVSFTGDKAAFAYLRLGVYGAIAVATFSRYRRLSYLAMGAAAVSAATSFSSGAWDNASGTPASAPVNQEQ